MKLLNDMLNAVIDLNIDPLKMLFCYQKRAQELGGYSLKYNFKDTVESICKYLYISIRNKINKT